MAHPQHNFTSNFNGSEGHNAELALIINGSRKTYTPTGANQEYNVPGVARIDVSQVTGNDLVQAITEIIAADALPILVDSTGTVEDTFVYQSSDSMTGDFIFGKLETNDIVLATVHGDGTISKSSVAIGSDLVYKVTANVTTLAEANAAFQAHKLVYLDGTDCVYLASQYVGGTGLIMYGATIDSGVIVVRRCTIRPDDSYLFGSGTTMILRMLGKYRANVEDAWVNLGGNDWQFNMPNNDSYVKLDANGETIDSLVIKLPTTGFGEGYNMHFQLDRLATGSGTIPISFKDGNGDPLALLRTNDSFSIDGTLDCKCNCEEGLLTILGNTWRYMELGTARQYVNQAELNKQLAALKSRIIYTVPLGAVDNLNVIQFRSDNHGAAHATLFNPPMNQDLLDGFNGEYSNVVVYLGETAQSVAHLIFAIYEFDKDNKIFNWVANTDDLASDADLKGNRYFPLTHVKAGQGSLFSDHLYLFVALVKGNNLRIAGNRVPDMINSVPLFLSCGLYNWPQSMNANNLETDQPSINTAQWSLTECRTQETAIARIFAAITNIQNPE